MNKFLKITSTVKSPKFSSGAVCAVTIAVILVANMILYVLGTTFGWYLYAPEQIDLSIKSHAVESQFNNAIKKINDGAGNKVSIIFCMTKEELAQHERGVLVYSTAAQLEAKYSDLIELNFINIITMRDKDNKSVDLSKYKTNPDGTSNSIYKTSVIFECEGRFNVINDTQSSEGFATFYTLSQDMSVTSYNGEEIICSMVLWVLREDHPTAYFTVGHGETSSSSLTSMFACAGYNLQTINLRENANAGIPVSNTENVVVISNPLTDFERGADGILAEIEALDAFVKKGGKIYVAIDPYIEAKQLSNLRSFLEGYGIKIATHKNESTGMILSNIVRDTEQSITTDGYTIVTGFSDSSAVERIKGFVNSYGSGNVLLREAAALELTGNAYPVLVSSARSVCETGGKVVDNSGSYCVAAATTVPVTGSSVTGAIFVASSAFLTADDVIVANGYSNKDFIYAVMDEIFYAETPPYGCSGVSYNTGMLEGLTMSTAKAYTVIACIIPAAIAAVGAVIIIRRRNR